MEHFAFQNALAEVFKVIGRANKYIDENAPWALAKDMEANGPRLARVMYNLLEATAHLRRAAHPLHARAAAEKLFGQIGACETCSHLGERRRPWGACRTTVTVTRGENLFPRIDMEKALAELEEAAAAAKKAALPALEVEPQLTEKVDFDTFCKSDFRAVKVKACETVKKSNKLLRFTLDDGTGTDRQILSGIAMWYKPEELVGKTLVAIVNLPPRKMMGLESNGMLISAVHTEHGRGAAQPADDRRQDPRWGQDVLNGTVGQIEKDLRHFNGAGRWPAPFLCYTESRRRGEKLAPAPPPGTGTGKHL